MLVQALVASFLGPIEPRIVSNRRTEVFALGAATA